MKPARVRIPGPHEEEDIMVLCRELHAENGIFPLNEEKVRAVLRRAFSRDLVILGVVGEPGQLEGMICILISSFWYSDALHLEELFLYVRPEYRRSRDAVELMQFAKWCSDDTNWPLVIGVISNERTAGKVRLYHRQFNDPVGNFYFYPGKTAEASAAKH